MCGWVGVVKGSTMRNYKNIARVRNSQLQLTAREARNIVGRNLENFVDFPGLLWNLLVNLTIWGRPFFVDAPFIWALPVWGGTWSKV